MFVVTVGKFIFVLTAKAARLPRIEILLRHDVLGEEKKDGLPLIVQLNIDFIGA